MNVEYSRKSAENDDEVRRKKRPAARYCEGAHALCSGTHFPPTSCAGTVTHSPFCVVAPADGGGGTAAGGGGCEIYACEGAV